MIRGCSRHLPLSVLSFSYRILMHDGLIDYQVLIMHVIPYRYIIVLYWCIVSQNK